MSNRSSVSRRKFLTTSLTAGVAVPSLVSLLMAQEKRPRRIVLRSSWQTVNIGDIAHTPGVLRLFQEYLPDVEVRLWPSNVDNGVEEMLNKRFPKVKIIKGRDDIKAALTECDFFLHGSGPGLVGMGSMQKWVDETKKPFGIYCTTLGKASPETIELLNKAAFYYFRDSVSLETAKQQGIHCPIMKFGPDGAFATDLRDDATADTFLKANGLEEGKFLCCIPRYRVTPYWKIHKKEMTDTDKKNWEHSQAMKEHDNGPLREAIIAVVKQTDLKVLVCPEDRSQVELGKEILVDPLPDDVKKRVVWRPNYWLTDEAVSTYVKSAGLFGLEMHSPIMCIGNGVPAIVCRFKEQTTKGFMWRDIGLDDWLFDFDDEESIKKLQPAVLAMAKDPAAAKAKALKAGEFVKQRQRETMAQVGKSSAV